MASRVTVTRWLFTIVFALSFALALVIYHADGPWHGVAVLSVMAAGAAYVAIFASEELVLRIDRWIGQILHWSP